MFARFDKNPAMTLQDIKETKPLAHTFLSKVFVLHILTCLFARFDENPAMTLQDIKETKHYGRTDRRTT